MARLGRLFGGGHDAGERFLREVRGLPGVTVQDPAAESEIERVEEYAGVRLPAAHRALLLKANGVMACWGYRRLYGVGDEPEHIGPWNLPDMWKFAWPQPLDDYLAIAGSGWGDQYAYRISDLRRGVPAIHRLDHARMEPTHDAMADDVEMFLRAFLVEAHKPGAQVHEARGLIGDLGAGELALQAPPVRAVGTAHAGASLQKVFAPAALIANGDVHRQLEDPAAQGLTPAGFEPYEDDMGRPRVLVRWA